MISRHASLQRCKARVEPDEGTGVPIGSIIYHMEDFIVQVLVIYDTVQNTSFSGILAFKCTVIKNNKNIVDL